MVRRQDKHQTKGGTLTARLSSAWDTQLLFLSVAALCLILPVGIGTNIDFKALLVIAAGGWSWVLILLNRLEFGQLLARRRLAALAAFGALMLLSSIINPHRELNFLGWTNVRLGTLSVLACIGIGLWLTRLPTRKLLSWFYIATVIVAATTLPYSHHLYGGYSRPGGAYYQADVLAAVLACGWFAGLALLQFARRSLKYIYLTQALLLVMLMITQTRAVLLITLLLTLVWLLTRQSLKRRLPVVLGLFVLVVAVAIFLLPAHVTDLTSARQSTQYRFSLQSAGLHASMHRPLLGYGAGNIKTALACSTLTAPALKQTCADGYYFDSSHNIFLDRVLAFGWPAGLIFIGLVAESLYFALRRHRFDVFAYCTLLVAAYYLTNVTNVEVELILWIVLMRAYVPTANFRYS